MAEKISLKSKIKVYAITNENDDVLAELRLDPDNDSTLGRFMDLYDNIAKIGEETQRKLESIERPGEKLDIATAQKLMCVNTEAIQGIITETDAMFGAGFTRQIFAEHYEVDENFIPNISLFKEFYEQVMPIIQLVYKESTNNYSVKKGKK